MSFYRYLMPLFLFVSVDTNAFNCGQGISFIGDGGSATSARINANINNLIKAGRNEIVDMSQITCRSGIRGMRERFYLTNVTAHNALQRDDINIVIDRGSFSLYTLEQLSRARLQLMNFIGPVSGPLPIRIAIETGNSPSQDLKIDRNTQLLTVTFEYENDSEGCQGCGTYSWNIFANNSTFITTNSCVFSAANNLEVDFGSFSSSEIAKTISSNDPLRTNLSVNYSCTNRSITSNIAIRLAADTSNFSTDLIRTNRENLGITAFDGVNPVKILETFQGRIVNGVGQKTIGFIPIARNNNSTVPSGPWSGSATLIMTLP